MGRGSVGWLLFYDALSFICTGASCVMVGQVHVCVVCWAMNEQDIFVSMTSHFSLQTPNLILIP